MISRRIKRTLMGQIVNTVELHLSGLVGTTSHPDMQKIRIIGFFIEKDYIGNSKLGCYYLQYVPASKSFYQA
jgi:hypothetical protein